MEFIIVFYCLIEDLITGVIKGLKKIFNMNTSQYPGYRPSEPPKRKDDELLWLLIVNIVFTLGLIFLDIFFGDAIKPLFKEYTFWGFVWIVAHLAAGFCWYMCIKHYEDPNKDYYRKLVLAALVAACLIIGIFGGQRNADKSDNIAPKYGMFDPQHRARAHLDSLRAPQAPVSDTMYHVTDDSVFRFVRQ
jgi:hypothetical protein